VKPSAGTTLRSHLKIGTISARISGRSSARQVNATIAAPVIQSDGP